jgi:hypothetical protein
MSALAGAKGLKAVSILEKEQMVIMPNVKCYSIEYENGIRGYIILI